MTFQTALEIPFQVKELAVTRLRQQLADTVRLLSECGYH